MLASSFLIWKQPQKELKVNQDYPLVNILTDLCRFLHRIACCEVVNVTNDSGKNYHLNVADSSAAQWVGPFDKNFEKSMRSEIFRILT